MVGLGDDLGDHSFDVVGVDAQCLADVHRPDFGAQVGLEVQLAAYLGAHGLAVLADHDEGGQEDRLQADDSW